MKAILHVGPHKTGTTSLQHFLTENGPGLASKGVYVPNIQSIDGSPNHWWLIYIASKSDQRTTTYHNAMRGGHSLKRCRELRSKYQDQLNQAITYYIDLESKQGLQGQFIISTEEVAFLDREEMNSLYRLLLEKCSDVEVLYYYRSPIDRLRSDLQQGSKGGHIHSPTMLKNLPCQDTSRMKRFIPDEDIQEKVRINVRPYKRGMESHKDWDIRLDVCETLGVTTESLLVRKDDPGANSNMSLQMFSILQQVNKMMPSTGKGGNYNSFRRFFHDAVESYKWTPEDEPFLFSSQDVSDLLGRKEEMQKFLALGESIKSVYIHPGCAEVFNSLGKTPVATGVEGSTLDYDASLSAKYVANLICNFWSFLMTKAMQGAFRS